MADGWIKAWRSMLDHPALKTPAGWTAWTKLLLRAAHKPCRVTWRGQPIALQPGEVALSIRQFADEIGLTHKQLRCTVELFTREGMLEQIPIYGSGGETRKGTIGTKLKIRNWATYQCDEGVAEGTTDDTPEDSIGAQQGHNRGTQNKNVRKDSESSLRSDSRALRSEFDGVFWPAYPNKKAKPKAIAAYKSARRKHSLEAIMAGVDRYKAHKNPEWAWLLPTTFLNQERFNDEYAEPKPYQNGHRNGHARQPVNQRASVVGAVQRLRDRREPDLWSSGDDAPRGEGREPRR